MRQEHDRQRPLFRERDEGSVKTRVMLRQHEFCRREITEVSLQFDESHELRAIQIRKMADLTLAIGGQPDVRREQSLQCLAERSSERGETLL